MEETKKTAADILTALVIAFLLWYDSKWKRNEV